MCGRRWVSAQPPASVAGRPSRTVASESSRPRVERSTAASTPERANCEMKLTDSNALSRCIGLVSESALKTPTLARAPSAAHRIRTRNGSIHQNTTINGTITTAHPATHQRRLG